MYIHTYEDLLLFKLHLILQFCISNIFCILFVFDVHIANIWIFFLNIVLLLILQITMQCSKASQVLYMLQIFCPLMRVTFFISFSLIGRCPRLTRAVRQMVQACFTNITQCLVSLSNDVNLCILLFETFFILNWDPRYFPRMNMQDSSI